jgi:hypothetical protein
LGHNLRNLDTGDDRGAGTSRSVAERDYRFRGIGMTIGCAIRRGVDILGHRWSDSTDIVNRVEEGHRDTGGVPGFDNVGDGLDIVDFERQAEVALLAVFGIGFQLAIECLPAIDRCFREREFRRVPA